MLYREDGRDGRKADLYVALRKNYKHQLLTLSDPILVKSVGSKGKSTNMTKFEDYLKDKFIGSYTGIKDDAETAEDNWMSDLDVQEVIDYAEEWGAELNRKYDIVVDELATLRVGLKALIK